MKNKILFIDRVGKEKTLEFNPGETIESVLVKNHIPVNSIIATINEKPISENYTLNESDHCIIRLIEGYDIDTILTKRFNLPNKTDNYLKNRLLFDLDGSIIEEHILMNENEIIKYMENLIYDTVTNYNLINNGDKVLLGLSGGVDSSALLLALVSLQKYIDFEIVAATFEDFDHYKNSPTMKNSNELAQSLGVKHLIIPTSKVTEIFNLKKPLNEIFPEMMKTKNAYATMYADHHTTRRALEKIAEEKNINKIILGLHTSDLLAGLINSWTTGYYVPNMFKRKIGNVTYIYPLMFIPKKELHLYFHAKTGKFAVHSSPNDWELNPTDRNFYYYLADILQYEFPGIENYVYEAHNWRLRRENPLSFTHCKNCGSAILQQVMAPINDELCDVCKLFKEAGYLNDE